MLRLAVSAMCALSMCSLLMPDPASAFGWGPTIKYAYQAGTLEEVDFDDDLEIKADIVGLGIQLDTNVAGNSVFNYRVEALVEFVEADAEYETAFAPTLNLEDDVDGVGFGLNHTFGFALVRDPNLRVYLGPHLRLGVFVGDTRTAVGDVDYTSVDVGLGPELGVNFHLNDKMSLSTTIGYQAQVSAIFTDDPRRPIFALFETDYGYVGYTSRVAVGVSVLFRSAGDVFE